MYKVQAPLTKQKKIKTLDIQIIAKSLNEYIQKQLTYRYFCFPPYLG